MLPLPTPRKIFDLEGEAQVNSDGRNRQEELLQCLPGERVELRLERPAGPGSDKVVVLSARGVPIGQLTSQYASLLAPHLKARKHRAKLHCLRGGVPDYPFYGARISIAWDDRPDHPHRPLDEEQLHYRERKSRKRGSNHPPAVKPGARNIGNGVAFRLQDRDTAGISLLLLALLLLAMIPYLSADAIASRCWACS